MLLACRGHHRAAIHRANRNPKRTDAEPRKMLPIEYATATARCPCAASRSVDVTNAENVVYAPINPVPSRGRTNQRGCADTVTSVTTTASANAPDRFTQNVSQGNDPDAEGHCRPIS